MDALRSVTILLALSVLGLLSAPAIAQIVPVSFAAEALMTTSTGVVRLCGMRLFAVEEGVGPRSVADGSVNIGVTGQGMVKGGLREIVVSPGATHIAGPRPSGFEFAWIKTAEGVLLAPGEVSEKIKADTEGFHLFAVPLEKALDFIEQATKGIPVYVGFVQKDGLEKILSGRVTWDAGAREEFHGCMAQLIREIDARLGSPTATGR